jgi:hypothetical protein
MYLFGDKGKPEVHQKSACTKKEVNYVLMRLKYAAAQRILVGYKRAGSGKCFMRQRAHGYRLTFDDMQRMKQTAKQKTVAFW